MVELENGFTRGMKAGKEFAPRFAPNSECLYVGDTIEKDLVKNVGKLTEVGFEITLHDKMPEHMIHLNGDKFLGSRA